MTVTGRTYTSTRPRGLADWTPQAATVEVLDAVNDVLDDYRAQLPLTGRQVYYRLVALGVIDKTEKDYGKLLEKLNRARRAGMIPWDAIRDDGVTYNRLGGYRGPDDFWLRLGDHGRAYRRDRHDVQPLNVEVWVEAAGMVPQAQRVADPYSIAVQSSGGFDSVTAKHDAARRFLDQGRPTVVLHVGDLDPSGCAVIDSLADDIRAFCRGYGRPGLVKFSRLAITPDQIDRYALPTAPQKATDKRGEAMVDTVQAEALTPTELAEVIDAGIIECLDLDAHRAVIDAEAEERQAVTGELDRMIGGAR